MRDVLRCTCRLTVFVFPPARSESSLEDAFLSRLLEKGATESSSATNSLKHEEEFAQTAVEKSKNTVCNIVAAIDDLWYLKDELQATILKALPEDGKLMP